MSEKKIIRPVALAVGAALAGTFAISGAVNADSVDSPFAMSTLSVAYMLGEGEAGGDEKEGEGSCGEKDGEGSCGDDKEDKDAEGSCGEGSCGGDKEDKDAEGSCGGST